MNVDLSSELVPGAVSCDPPPTPTSASQNALRLMGNFACANLLVSCSQQMRKETLMLDRSYTSHVRNSWRDHRAFRAKVA